MRERGDLSLQSETGPSESSTDDVAFQNSSSELQVDTLNSTPSRSTPSTSVVGDPEQQTSVTEEKIKPRSRNLAPKKPSDASFFRFSWTHRMRALYSNACELVKQVERFSR